MKEKNEWLLHKGRKRLNFQDEENIVEDCNKVSKFQGNNVGAIVMNCNPFTLGHRYLVEQALQHVDELYLFVVEENRSFFSFEHRFKMVKAGVADLKNVEIIPSGKFILSHQTFHNYFEKEYLQKVEIDASKDLFIFAEYIAKELNIKIRFVGEEPFDTVTRQYNAQMKKILGDAGIDVLEIPRKKIGSMAISASRVRQCITKQNWQEVSQLVPETTMKYLHDDLNILKKRK